MVDMLKFPTVSAGDMVTLMRFGGIKMQFGGTFQTFSPAFTNAFVVFLLSFLFVGFKTILAIKFAVAVWTFKGWLDPRSIIWAGLICSKTGGAVLSTTIVVGGALDIITLIAQTTVIGTIDKGRDAS